MVTLPPGTSAGGTPALRAPAPAFEPSAAAVRIATCGWAVAFVAWLAWYYRFSSASLLAFVCHAAIGVPIIALADPRWRAWLQARFPMSWHSGLLTWLVLLALIWLTGTPAQRSAPSFVAIWAAYLALPIAVFAMRSDIVRPILGAAALVIPVGALPMVRLAEPGRDPYSIGVLVIVGLALMLLLLLRPDPDVRFRLWLSRREAGVVLIGFLGYAVVALPVGLALGFMRPGLAVSTIGAAIARMLEIFFFVAIPEELVGRAMLQNGLERWLGPARGLGLTAVIFGLAHIGHPPVPNWRYVLLAAGAGAVYGWVFQKTRNVTASALTHALVDSTWFLFFAGLIPR